MSGDFVGQDKTVCVAKGHYCHGCGEWFERGEYMRYQAGKSGGAFYSRYWCEPCYLETLKNPFARLAYEFSAAIRNFKAQF